MEARNWSSSREVFLSYLHNRFTPPINVRKSSGLIAFSADWFLWKRMHVERLRRVLISAHCILWPSPPRAMYRLEQGQSHASDKQTALEDRYYNNQSFQVRFRKDEVDCTLPSNSRKNIRWMILKWIMPLRRFKPNSEGTRRDKTSRRWNKMCVATLDLCWMNTRADLDESDRHRSAGTRLWPRISWNTQRTSTSAVVRWWTGQWPGSKRKFHWNDDHLDSFTEAKRTVRTRPTERSQKGSQTGLTKRFVFSDERCNGSLRSSQHRNPKKMLKNWNLHLKN